MPTRRLTTLIVRKLRGKSRRGSCTTFISRSFRSQTMTTRAPGNPGKVVGGQHQAVPHQHRRGYPRTHGVEETINLLDRIRGRTSTGTGWTHVASRWRGKALSAREKNGKHQTRNLHGREPGVLRLHRLEM